MDGLGKDVTDILKIDLLDSAYVSDVDGNGLTIALDSILFAGKPLPSFMTLDADGHTILVDLNSADLDFIRQSDKMIGNISYVITDDYGASVNNSVEVNIVGTNDAPVVSGPVTAAVNEGDVASTLDALANASDVDYDTTKTLQVVSVQDNLPAGVTYDADTNSFTFDPKDAAYNHMAAGDTDTVTVKYFVTDGIAAPVPASVSWTITGTNDAPVAQPVENLTVEDKIVTGSVAATDADDGAVLTYELVSKTAGGSFEFKSDGSYSLDPSGKGFEDLNVGESRDYNVTYKATDEHGISSESTLTIHVDGVNDAPIASADTAAADEDGVTITRFRLHQRLRRGPPRLAVVLARR